MRRDRFRDFNFIKGGSKGILRDTVYPFVPPADLKWNGDGEKRNGGGKRRESARCCCIRNGKENPGIVAKKCNVDNA